MATPVLDQGRGRPGEVGRIVPISPEQNHNSLLNRTVYYVPRFTRHFRRRLRSNMSLGHAWRSARQRMHEYR
jgi:hypothetical protein